MNTNTSSTRHVHEVVRYVQHATLPHLKHLVLMTTNKQIPLIAVFTASCTVINGLRARTCNPRMRTSPMVEHRLCQKLLAHKSVTLSRPSRSSAESLNPHTIC